jgi:peptidoglycan hydrolase-like amidase
LGATALPAAAQEVPPTYLTSTVELVPAPGTILSYEGRFYTGRLRVSGHAGGLAVVETVTLDQYLLGIREVPFAWHKEALRAQVVAARTYLAWTLQGGRSINGRRYDYDICATTACQVYSGSGWVIWRTLGCSRS